MQGYINLNSSETISLVGLSTWAPNGYQVYAFFDIRNESSASRTLIVHFIGPDEEVRGGVELEIPPSVPRWRTWAFTRWAKEPGLWRVEVRDVDGKLVGALPFEVAPDC